MKEIIVAGGCFWGVCEYFNRLKGIDTAKAVYAQGKKKNPTYEDVCSGNTGFTEGAYLVYDESIISLENIIDHLFRIIDPTSLNKQGGDIGDQYRTGIYYFENEHQLIRNKIENFQEKYEDEIVVEVEEVTNYFIAEEYHQNYLMKNPTGYCHVDFSKIKANEKK